MNTPPLARQHQIHGVQPVLPVPDVDAAAAWFCDVLGFEIDFIVGTPAQHGRVRLGDRSWGDPIYLHLSRSDAAVQPCGEMRLHVGHDLDGLHAHVLAQGGRVTLPPIDQPWGLREFVVQGPGGHLLRLCAEIAPTVTNEVPRPVIACYRPRPGHEAALRALVQDHVPTLRRLGLATGRGPLAMRAADGTLVEAFEWSSAAAIAAAHHHPEVQAMWAAFGAACEYVRLAQVPEATQLFAEFSPIDA
jgi:catechol 2,3-dioxygenase-like lactoylglutathione lyase family enzyme